MLDVLHVLDMLEVLDVLIVVFDAIAGDEELNLVTVM